MDERAQEVEVSAHEVLCVVGGNASIAFGGPEGEKIEVEAGDVVVIPAGVGHCNAGSSGDFTVIGGSAVRFQVTLDRPAAEARLIVTDPPRAGKAGHGPHLVLDERRGDF